MKKRILISGIITGLALSLTYSTPPENPKEKIEIYQPIEKIINSPEKFLGKSFKNPLTTQTYLFKKTINPLIEFYESTLNSKYQIP